MNAEAVASDKIEAARITILERWPYYSHILFMLQPVYGGTETLSVDQHLRLYLNAEWVARTADWQIIWLLLHQINHVVRDHNQRGVGKDRLLWNIAADLEINGDMLRTKGLKEPKGCLMPKEFGFRVGELAETYYGMLTTAGDVPENKASEAQQRFGIEGNQPAKSEDDTPNTHSSSSSDGSDSENPADGSDGTQDPNSSNPSSASTSGAPSAGNCGCVAGGGSSEQAPKEAQLSDTDKTGHDFEAVQRARERAITAIDEHVRDNGIGSVPAGLLRIVEKARRPQANWRNLLRRYILKARNETRGQVNYSWRRPNRRQGSLRRGDPVLPATMRPVPNIGLVIDTSGSMSNKDLADCLSEASGIIAASGQVVCVACDEEAYTPERTASAKQITLAGGGGTDMRAGIAAAMRTTPKPDVVVVLTDGYTPWPDKKPSAPLVVGLIGEEAVHKSRVPEWTLPVIIKPD